MIFGCSHTSELIINILIILLYTLLYFMILGTPLKFKNRNFQLIILIIFQLNCVYIYLRVKVIYKY